MRRSFFLLTFIFLFLLGLTFKFPVHSATVEELENQIGEYTRLIKELEGQNKNLTNQVNLMETKEKVTKVKIDQTQGKIKMVEGEIATLSAKIVKLDSSLNYISKVFLSRILATYKTGINNQLTVLFSSRSVGDYLTKYKYFRVVQLSDRNLLLSVEETKVNYDEQKKTKELMQKQLSLLKKQLEVEKANLAVQLVDRKRLLAETRGKEAEYQRLLAASRSELEAIQQIAAGEGVETEVGKINTGERIAGIIYGASACSTGTHLHFEIRENGNLKNPFDYLKNVSLADQSGGDPHEAKGNWDWPLNETIKFNQGYGENTSAIRSRIVWYKFHTGIDISSDSLTVKAVKSGTLYRGGVACGGGTLRYVRVHQDEGGIDTYYLHVNY